MCIEDDPPVSNSNNNVRDSPVSLRSECEIGTSTPTDKPHKSKHKSKSKRSQVMDEGAIASDGFITSVEENNVPKPQKKKKKKKRQNLTDAETNTTQVINMEPIRPPPRLEPIKAEVLAMATPPLRNRLSHQEPFIDSLPPSGGSVERRKHRTTNTSDIPGESVNC